MAFTFQINNSLKFNHDENLLAKADQYRPGIHKKEIKAQRLAEVTQDETWLGGYGVKESETGIGELSSLRLKKNDSLILDFGTHCTGTFSVHIDSAGSPMDAPLHLRLRFAEMPLELKAESDTYDGWLSSSWIQEEFIHLDELPCDLKLPRRYSCRYVEILVKDTSPKWQAVFSDPVFLSESSVDDSSFEPLKLQDDVLQKIYDTGVKTLYECMQDVFEDGPKRDRRLWLGDLRLQALADYASFDQPELVKRCLYLFAAMTTEEGKIPANVFVKPRYVPDDTFLFEYSLFFVSVLYDLIQAHPDMETLRDLWPCAKKQMDLTLKMVSENGKLITDENYPVFVDWSNDFNKDTCAEALVIYALKQFIELAKLMKEESLSVYEAMLEKMISYTKNELYDPEKKLFVSEGEYNIASQVWMILAHVMSEEENHMIMENTIARLFPIKGIATPYMYHHIVQAMFESGHHEEAVKLMKEYWGKMIALGADTFWEAFDPDHPEGSPYGSAMVNSYCHAWSCTPVWLIRKYMM